MRIFTAVTLLAQLWGNGIPLSQALPLTSYPGGYAPNPWTTPICAADPCTPALTVDPNSATQIASIMTNVGAFALGEIQQRDPSTDGTHGISGSYPVYYASATDPTFTLSCDGGASPCQHVPATLPMPQGARGAGTADHHLIVVQPNGTAYAFEQFNDNGSGTGTTFPIACPPCTVSVKGGGFATSLTMYAGGGVCTTCDGSQAAYTPVEQGLLDPRELVRGLIPHAINVAVFCPSSSFFWPAHRSDGPCPSGPGEGELIWLNLSDAQIANLGFCSWETTILIAMHHYGLFVGDTGPGPEGWDFKSVDDWSQLLYGGQGNWSLFWTWLSSSCPSAVPAFAGGASHMQLLTTGLSAANLEVLHY